MKKIIVDKNVCIGCGFCAANLEEVFIMDDDNLATTTDKNIINNMNDSEKEELIDVKEGCPVGAIKVEEN